MKQTQITELECAVIRELLRDPELNPLTREFPRESASVSERRYTGIGFMVEFERSEALKLFPDNTSLRWGNVGARLNESRLDTSYVVYVDDGYLTGVEGYTYGEEWPKSIRSFEIYPLEVLTSDEVRRG